MSHLPFTILAYFFNSVSVTINKFLLKKSIPDPFVYIFYISIFSLILIPALPFTHIPGSSVLTLASISTLLWTSGAYFMFKALKIGVISRVIPIIGTLIPLILLIIVRLHLSAFQSSSITINQTWAVGFLVLGLIFITLLDWKGKFSKTEVLFEVLSSILFALSYILLRQAYLQGDFFSILVWGRVILIPLILLILLTPLLRKRVTASEEQINIFGKAGLIFLLAQATGGASELLLLFSISLANPALVNSLQGSQYIFLLIFGIFLKEKFSKLSLITKLLGIIFIALGLYILSSPQTPKTPHLGVTYSPRYAYQLGLEPKMTFIKMLDQLKVTYLRLPVYWEEVEKFPYDLNFSSVDYYLDLARTRDIKVILVLGYKQPRWPECFDPPWVKNLIRSERDLRILKLVQAEIDHFKKYQNIIAWQMENEPMLTYGECDNPDSLTLNRLKQEVNMVKNADPRPVLITDSGELSSWRKVINLSEWFGTTIYRTVWTPQFGYFEYPVPPIFYLLKDQLLRTITQHQGPTIISELQAEPWTVGSQPTEQVSVRQQVKILPVSKLKSNISYAKETGFSQIYLWGVEWWYFMAKNGHPEYLEEAKKLFH